MPVSESLPAQVAESLKDFRTVTSLPVQWGDMDAFGHVNNVVYIRWFESARVDLLDSLESSVTMQPGSVGPILASIKCDYKRQLHFPDTVHIGSRCLRVGRSSVDVEHSVFSQQQKAVVATGVSVLVVFDYQQNRPVRVPADLRAQLEN